MHKPAEANTLNAAFDKEVKDHDQMSLADGDSGLQGATAHKKQLDMLRHLIYFAL
jgi:hypothetical protein